MIYKGNTNLQNQKITVLDCIDNSVANKTPNRSLAIGLIGATIGATVMMLTMTHCDPKEVKADCYGCHRKVAFTKYFKGSVEPEKLAEAVLYTRNPRLLAAIHVGGEKRTPHTARNTGYKKRHDGAWQTSKRWGKAHDVTEQALIAEFALETHVKEQKSNIVRGLNAYGGESDLDGGQYAKRVLAELTRVP